MKHFRSIGSAALACALGFAVLPNLRADEWNKKTTITVNEAVQVPSCCTPDHTITLQPGEYVLALVDSLSDRHIVRIFDKNQEHVMTTILAIPNYRLQPTDKTVIQYWEVPAGHPKAIRAWFYPGDNFGQEFVYEKKAAVEIAAFVKTPVPAIEVETKEVEELKSAPLVVVDESGGIKEFKAEPAPQPVVAAAQPEPAPAPAPVVVAEAPAQTLPHTASSMPLIGLMGLVSLGLFAAVSTVTRRRNSSQG
jgi:LPXTG-motif cell wall-anchored protein